MNWIRSTFGIVVGVFVAALIILGIWKGQSIWDYYLGDRYNKKTASSEAHGDSAATFKSTADTARAQGVVLRSHWNTLTNSPEVRNNPTAIKVRDAGNKVIAKDSIENTALRNSNSQLGKQVVDLTDRGKPTIPRAIPYVDILYTRSILRNYGVPVTRAGVDYRLYNWIKVKGELSYEPPSTTTPDVATAVRKVGGPDLSSPEFRVNLGVHITFR